MQRSIQGAMLAILLIFSAISIPAQAQETCPAELTRELNQNTLDAILAQSDADLEGTSGMDNGACPDGNGYKIADWLVTGSSAAAGDAAVTISGTTVDLLLDGLTISATNDGLITLDGASKVTLQDITGTGTILIEDSTAVFLKNVEADTLIIRDGSQVTLEDSQFETMTVHDSFVYTESGGLSLTGTDGTAAETLLLVRESAIELVDADLATSRTGETLPIDFASTSGHVITITGGDLTAVDAPCIRINGGDLHIGYVDLAAADCPVAVVKGSTDLLEFIDSQIALDDGAIGVDVNVAGELDILRNEFVGGDHAMRLSQTGNDFWNVAFNDLTGQAEESIHLDASIRDLQITGNVFSAGSPIMGASGTATIPGAITFYDNDIQTTDAQFVGANPLDTAFDLALHTGPTPGTNILGYNMLGGNAWADYDGFDADSDGFGQDVFKPAGIAVADELPLVMPNEAPIIHDATATPDPADPLTLYRPGDAFSFWINATDDDPADSELTITWTLDGEQLGLGDTLDLTVEDHGPMTVLGTVSDTAGARIEVPFHLHIDAENLPATFTQAPSVVDCLNGDAVDLSEDPVFVDTEVCFAMDAVDDRAGIHDRLDSLYVDLDLDNTVSVGDLRISRSDQFPVGLVTLVQKDVGLALSGDLMATPIASADGGFLDVGCDGPTSGDVRLFGVDLDQDNVLDMQPGHRVRISESFLPPDMRVPPCGPMLEVWQGTTGIYFREAPGGDPEVMVGDLRLDGSIVESGAMDLTTPLTSTQGHVRFLDRDAVLSYSWDARVGSTSLIPQQGKLATLEFQQTGIATVTGVARDQGTPSTVAFEELTFPVLDDSLPSPFFTMDPPLRSYTEAGTLVLEAFRASTFTLDDASLIAAPNEIESITWGVGGLPPEAVGDADLSDSSLTLRIDSVGDFPISLTVEASNTQSATLDAILRIVPSPPEASMTWSPLIMDAETPVTFSATGGLDSGTTLTGGSVLSVIEVGTSGPTSVDLLVLDVDGDGLLGDDDPLLQSATLTLRPGHLLGISIDTGSHSDTAMLETCFGDNDLNGDVTLGDELWAAVDCSDISPGDIRLLSTPAGPFGSHVASGAPDDGASAAVMPSRFVHTLTDGNVDTWFLKTTGDTLLTTGDVVLSGLGAGSILADGDPGFGEEPETSSASYRSVDGFTYIASDATLSAQDLRLTGGQVHLQPFYPAGPIGIGHGLTPITGTACYVDHDESGDRSLDVSGIAEPMFVVLRDTCDVSSEGDVRLQADSFGSQAPAGTVIRAGDADHGLDLTSAGAFGSADVQGTTQSYIDVDMDGQISSNDKRLHTDSKKFLPGSDVLGPSFSDDDTPLTYHWTCTQGCPTDVFSGVSHLPQPTVEFTTSGPKTVRLQVTDIRGAGATQLAAIIVANLPPTPDFTISHADPTDLDIITFDAAPSFDADSPGGTLGLQYKWHFSDDDARPPGPVVSHQFMEPGTYTVTLTVTDGDTLNPLKQSISKEVTVRNVAPTADFSIAPVTPLTGASVIFDSAPSVDLDGTIEAWRWTFSDAATPQAGPVASRTYARAGTYEATLTVTDDRGLASSVTHDFQVANRAPVAAATVDQSAQLPPATLTFDASGSKDPEGTALTYSWDFDDGSSGTGRTISHEFTDRGSYEVVLTVIDEDGGSDQDTVLIQILNQPPVVTMTAPGEITAGTPVKFEAVAFDAEGDAITYDWVFSGPEDVSPLSGSIVDVTFPKWGNYKVTVTATDASGDASERSKTVRVQSIRPTASLDLSKSEVVLGEALSATGTASDTDGDIVSHFLDFGDGTSAFTASATHAYTKPGIYTIQYRASDDSQASGVASKQVTVINPVPTISLMEVTPSDPQINDLLLFNADVDDDSPGLSYLWDFKDGVVSNKPTPTHVFRIPGTFQVSLTVTDAFGAKTTQLLEVQVVDTKAGSEETDADGESASDDGDLLGDKTRRVDQEAPGPWVALLGVALLLLARRRR